MNAPLLQQSSRNPLGILAMFISFAYLAMVVAFTIGLDKLNPGWERGSVIAFLVLFPLIILSVFSYMIVCHNGKLYGPKDYRDDKSFVLMSGRDITRKNETEVLQTENPSASTQSSTKSMAANYAIAQQKAVLQISKWLSVKFTEYVKLEVGGRELEFDALGDSRYGKYIIECKLIKGQPASSRLQQIKSTLEQYSAALNQARIPHRLFLVLIVDQYTGDIGTRLREYFKENSPETVIYVFDYQKLIKE